MNNNFSNWFMENWEKTEGLICQADAAKLLDITRQSIKTRIKTGSLKAYEYIDENKKKSTYVSLKDIAKLKLKRGWLRRNHEYPRNQTQKDK